MAIGNVNLNSALAFYFITSRPVLCLVRNGGLCDRSIEHNYHIYAY